MSQGSGRPEPALPQPGPRQQYGWAPLNSRFCPRLKAWQEEPHLRDRGPGPTSCVAQGKPCALVSQP